MMNISQTSRRRKRDTVIRVSATVERSGVWTAGLESVVDECGESCVASAGFAHGIDGEIRE